MGEKNKRKHIYYLSHYACGEDINKYNVAIPARKKIDYILFALEQAGYTVDIFSIANSKSNVILFPKCVVLNSHVTVRYSLCVNRANKLLSLISSILRYVQIVFYILFRVPTNGLFLVYHSNSFIRPIQFARRIKKIKLIIDIEEIYTELFRTSPKEAQLEKNFLQTGNSYIVVNDILALKYGTMGKSVAVAYGDYRMSYIPGLTWSDSKIHVVYAGTIEQKKRGAFTAVETARLLPQNFKTHIIGFGREEVLSELKQRIVDVNKEQGFESVQFDGFKSGIELDEYLSRCDIGLSTYVLTDSFANNSFPSKLMSYVVHNLQVVTGDAKAFRNAKVSSNWLFYKDYTPESIANAIMEYNREKRQSNEVIVKELNEDFITSLRFIF